MKLLRTTAVQSWWNSSLCKPRLTAINCRRKCHWSCIYDGLVSHGWKLNLMWCPDKCLPTTRRNQCLWSSGDNNNDLISVCDLQNVGTGRQHTCMLYEYFRVRRLLSDGQYLAWLSPFLWWFRFQILVWSYQMKAWDHNLGEKTSPFYDYDKLLFNDVMWSKEGRIRKLTFCW